MKSKTLILARAGVIGALYAVLALPFMTIVSGPIQFRISEALTLLPLFFPEAIAGVFVGCIVVNLITGCAALDIIFGSLITLVAGVLTYLVGRVIKNHVLRIFVGGLFPVLLNAFFLPLIWLWAYGSLEYLYIVQVAYILVGQAAAVYALGTALYFFIADQRKRGVGVFS